MKSRLVIIYSLKELARQIRVAVNKAGMLKSAAGQAGNDPVKGAAVKIGAVLDLSSDYVQRLLSEQAEKS